MCVCVSGEGGGNLSNKPRAEISKAHTFAIDPHSYTVILKSFLLSDPEPAARGRTSTSMQLVSSLGLSHQEAVLM